MGEKFYRLRALTFTLEELNFPFFAASYKSLLFIYCFNPIFFQQSC